MISVAGLSFLHPGAATGFDDVSFVVSKGVTAALIGDNGVGKTTLLRILAGELEADDGTASVTGSLRYMPQELGFDRFLHVGEDGHVHALSDPDTAIDALLHGLGGLGHTHAKQLTA